MTTTIGLLLFPDVEELDVVGPWEVFGMAAMSREDLSIVTLAQAAEPVRCAKGMRLLPDHTLADAPSLDVLLVPGGNGTRRLTENGPLLDWIAGTAENCRWVTSVCTGSRLLLAAGPARGRRITTHWSAIEELRNAGAAAEVIGDQRFVVDGNLVTAAGVSAGIDMALWLVGQIYDPSFARSVQRWMEYDPDPPYADLPAA